MTEASAETRARPVRRPIGGQARRKGERLGGARPFFSRARVYILGLAPLLILALWPAGRARAANISWSGSCNNNWYNAACWTPQQVPGSADTVTIDANVNVLVNASSPTIHFSSMTLGDSVGTNAASLTISTTLAGGYLIIYNKSGLTFATTVQTSLSALSNNITMFSGSTMTHTANSTVSSTTLLLNVGGNFDLQAGSTVTVDGKGYAGGAVNSDGYGPAFGIGSGAGGRGGGGAGHGGTGGAGSGSGAGAGGGTSDSLNNPTDLGSGGGGGSGGGAGGAGGGAVILNITGTLSLNGQITAQGSNGVSPASLGGGGGGAGGTINITAGTLTGSGTLQAGGGNGGNGAGGGYGGGGGGGGRIAVAANTNSFIGTVSTSTTRGTGGGGAGTGTAGSIGTVFSALEYGEHSVGQALNALIGIGTINNAVLYHFSLSLSSGGVWISSPVFELSKISGGFISTAQFQGANLYLDVNNNGSFEPAIDTIVSSTGSSGVFVSSMVLPAFTATGAGTFNYILVSTITGVTNVPDNSFTIVLDTGITGWPLDPSPPAAAGKQAFKIVPATLSSATHTDVLPVPCAFTWAGSGGNGDWFTGSNWNKSSSNCSAQYPTAIDTVTIDLSGANVAAPASDPAIQFASMTLGDAAATAVSLTLSTTMAGGSLTINQNSGLTCSATYQNSLTGDVNMFSGSSMTLGAASIAGNLYMNAGSTATLTGPISVKNNLPIQSGSLLTFQTLGTSTVTGNVTMYSGSYMTQTTNPAATSVESYRVNLNVGGNFDLQAGSTVTVDGKGYAGGAVNSDGYGPTLGGGGVSGGKGGGGAGHGGGGGTGGAAGGAGGGTSDSLNNPTDLGSGGGGGSGGGVGGAGGGAVILNVIGTLSLNGLVTAQGTNGVASAFSGGGGGAGGAINITAGTLTGAGTLQAGGGNGGNGGGAGGEGGGGGGGGGRIAIAAPTNSFTGTVSTATAAGTGGTANSNGAAGAVGTVFSALKYGEHSAGQMPNMLIGQGSVRGQFYRFSVQPSSGGVSIAPVFVISSFTANWAGGLQNDITGASVYYDANGDGVAQLSETVVQSVGSGAVGTSGPNITITFPAFDTPAATAGPNYYVLVATITNVVAGDSFTVTMATSSAAYLPPPDTADTYRAFNLTTSALSVATHTAPSLPANCWLGYNVKQDGSMDFTSISPAVTRLQQYIQALSTTTCVVVRDTQTYSEQVTAQNFAPAGARLQIMSDPSFISSAPVVNPPASSTAAFQIMNASVTIQNIAIVSTIAVVTYGVYASSAYVTLSSVSVTDPYVGAFSSITFAGVWISSYSSVSYSTVSVHNAHGIYLPGAVQTTVSFSTITTSGGASYAALYLNNASSNTFSGDYIADPNWLGAYYVGANYNTISQSTITGLTALDLNPASYNTFSGDYIIAPNGYGAYYAAGSNGNTIAQSTLTTSGAYPTLYLLPGSSNAFTNDYIQGSTAVYVSGSTGTVIGGSVLIGTNTFGSGLWLTGGSVGLALTTTTLRGGSKGAGIYLDPYNSGVISLSTNAVSGPAGDGGAGAQYGIYIATQMAGTQLWITSNTIVPTVTSLAMPGSLTAGIYINGLTTGATIYSNAVVYRNSGSMGANTSYGIYAQSAPGLYIHNNVVSDPGMITAGSFAGAYLTASQNATFKFNDVNGTVVPGNTLSALNLLKLSAGSTGALVKDNIFVSSPAVSGSSAAVIVDATSSAGFASDYNDFFSPNPYNNLSCSGTIYALPGITSGEPASAGAFSWTCNGTQDAHSIAADPLWYNPAANTEDFHPLSKIGRCSNPAYSTTINSPATSQPDCAGYTVDGSNSPTVDAGDPGEPAALVNLEPAPNVVCSAARANLGSTGETYQASLSQSLLPNWANPPQCGIVRNVYKTLTCQGTYPTIQAGVAALPSPALGDNACVVVRDTWTYSEQVNVTTFTFTYSSNTLTIMSDPSFISSAPVVTPPTSSTAAFQITNASVTLQHLTVVSTNAITYGVYASSPNVTISSVNIVGGSSITLAGVYISSSWVTVSYSSVTVNNAHGIFLDGGANGIAHDAVSYSTAQTSGSNAYALYIYNASSGTFNVIFASNSTGGYGAYLNNYSDYNTISRSTMTASGSGATGLYLNGHASYNSISQSYMQASYGAYLDQWVNYNTISFSTVVSPGGGYSALNFSPGGGTANGFNLVTNSYMLTQSGNGAAVGIGGNSSMNTVTLSTVATAGGTSLQISNASSGNAVTSDFFSYGTGYGVYLYAGANYNTISNSTITGSTSNYYALYIAGATNTVTQNMILNPGGWAAYLDASGNWNTISQSTITSNSSTKAALSVITASSNTILNSYIQGSTAAYITGSTGTVIGGSVLIGTNTFGSGLWLAGGSVGLTLTTTTLQGGSQGAGIYLDRYNSGVISISTSAVSGPAGDGGAGAQYGLFIATQMSGTQLWISSNTIVPTVTSLAVPGSLTAGIYLNGLTSGATIYNNAVVYRNSGSMGSNTSYGIYAQSSPGLYIHNNVVSDPGMITAGSFAGAYFTASQNATFKFNDINGTVAPGNTLSALNLLQLSAGSTGALVKDNIFVSSPSVSGSSAAVVVDAQSSTGFSSDYNDFFSPNPYDNLSCNGTLTSLPGIANEPATGNQITPGSAFSWSCGGSSQDKDSIAADPLWNNPAANTEDFHPQSTAGRCSNPAYSTTINSPATSQPDCTAYATSDTSYSPTIDAGDPNEPASLAALEPSPNGSQCGFARPNLGSTGESYQASLSPPTATPWSTPTNCGIVRNVYKTQACGVAYPTIQAGVAALPSPTLGTNACVVVRDTWTYSEQVSVTSFTFTYSSNTLTIMSDPSFTSLLPVVTPPTSSTAAFQISNASVTLQRLTIVSTNAITYGVWASSPNITISSVNINDNGSITAAGVYISTNWVTVSYSSVTVNNAIGFSVTGSSNSVSYSTSAVKIGAFAALQLSGASYNSFNVFLASSAAGDGADLLSGANFNTISRSTMIVAGTVGGALSISGSTSNVISSSYMSSRNSSTSSNAVYLGGAYNTISQSTMTTQTSGSGGAITLAGSSNTITGSNILNNFHGDAVWLTGAYDTIKQSTIAVNWTADALHVTGSFNIVNGSYITDFNNGGRGAKFTAGAQFNTLSGSTIVISGNFLGGFELYGASNTISSSLIKNSVGDGGDVYSNGNVISQSTITSLGSNNGLYLSNASSNTVLNSYIQGSTAAYITGSTGTVIGGSVLIGTNTFGSGLWLAGGSVNLTLTTTTLQGGSKGAGIYLDPYNSGVISISTNVIAGPAGDGGAGAQYGIYIATQMAGTQLWITSNTIVPTVTSVAMPGSLTAGIYINGLATGATIYNNAVVYRNSGSMGSNTSYGIYAQSSTGLYVHHNRVSDPGIITGGSFIGAYFTASPNATFKFNDVNASVSGASLSSAYLLQAAAGSTGAVVKDNVFVSSLAVTGSSATVNVDAASTAGFAADYNDYFSSNAYNSLLCGAARTALPGISSEPVSAGGFSWTCNGTQDAHSTAADPLWYNPAANTEDFHPRSTVGRCSNPTYSTSVNAPATSQPDCAAYATDPQDSPTTDAGDPNENPTGAGDTTGSGGLGKEPGPNGCLPNQGSYGQTYQASLSAPILGISLSSTYYNFTPGAPLQLGVTLSTMSVSSITVVNAGNGPETYSISATTTPTSTGWTLGTLPAYNTPVLNAVFNSAAPSAACFNVSMTTATSSSVTSGAASGSPCVTAGGNYAGNQSGAGVAVGAAEGLWFRLWTPTSASLSCANTPMDFKVTLTATGGSVCSN